MSHDTLHRDRKIPATAPHIYRAVCNLCLKPLDGGRVDVPEFDGQPPFTRLYGAAAIYSITPCTEELARKAARYCRAEPVTVYIPPDRRIPESTSATREVREAHECATCGGPCYCDLDDDGMCSLCGKCDPGGVDDPDEGAA